MDCVSVPHAVRPYADQVVAATDAVCLEHLDVEYAGLCRKVVGKLGRKRPSPLTRGDLGIWAAGVVYVVGQLNFVFDPAQTPACELRPAQRVVRREEDHDGEQGQADPRHPAAARLR